MSYRKIGEITEADREGLLSATPRLQLHGGPGEERNYYLAALPSTLLQPVLGDLIPNWKGSAIIAVALKPDGYLHRHIHDTDGDQGKTRFHVVLKTNPQCETYNGDGPYFLDDLGVYRMEPFLPHEAFNYGETDRLHLVLVTVNPEN